MKWIAQSGEVIGRYTAREVAAGSSAEVSWFPGVTGLGGGSVQTFVGARIQAPVVQNIPSNINTDLHYTSTFFDTDGMVNLVGDNRILTVNTAGLYLVICETVWAFNSAGRRINTVIQNGFYSGAPIPPQFSASDSVNAIWTGSGRTSNTSIGASSSGVFNAAGSTIAANGFNNAFLSALLIGSS